MNAVEQVEFGYPFVATTLPELEEMLDLLRGSAVLRQAASRIMLDMAKYLSVSSSLDHGVRGDCREGSAMRQTLEFHSCCKVAGRAECLVELAFD